MKKFYEKPVVEITKFAFEDIMTATPSNVVLVEANGINAQTVIDQIEAANANVQAKRFSTYKW